MATIAEMEPSRDLILLSISHMMNSLHVISSSIHLRLYHSQIQTIFHRLQTLLPLSSSSQDELIDSIGIKFLSDYLILLKDLERFLMRFVSEFGLGEESDHNGGRLMSWYGNFATNIKLDLNLFYEYNEKILSFDLLFNHKDHCDEIVSIYGRYERDCSDVRADLQVFSDLLQKVNLSSSFQQQYGVMAMQVLTLLNDFDEMSLEIRNLSKQKEDLLDKVRTTTSSHKDERIQSEIREYRRLLDYFSQTLNFFPQQSALIRALRELFIERQNEAYESTFLRFIRKQIPAYQQYSSRKSSTIKHWTLFIAAIFFAILVFLPSHDVLEVGFVYLLAQLGHSHSQYLIGSHYQTGYGLPQSLPLAMHWYELAAHQGNNSLAQYILGLHYDSTPGYVNTTEAIRLYTLAANQGIPAAAFYLGYHYEHGRGVSPNFTEALRWFDIAIQRGSPQAQHQVGLLHALGRINGIVNKTEALRLLNLAVRQGHSASMNDLGLFYESGSIIPQNLTEAGRLYSLSALAGDHHGQYNLARCYESGLGVPLNLTQAVFWYNMSANQGNSKAQQRLGVCYQTGAGVIASPIEAVKYFKLSASQKNYKAICSLSHCHMNGIGVTRNQTEGVRLATLAASHGEMYCQYNLGTFYHYGEGVEPDILQAITWYHYAGEQGVVPAQEMLGDIYRQGVSHIVQKDRIESLKWYHLAASSHGSASAQYKLGASYDNTNTNTEGEGEGERGRKRERERVSSQENDEKIHDDSNRDQESSDKSSYDFSERNPSLAMKWYRRAGDQGHAESQYQLGRHYQTGDGVHLSIPKAIKWYRLAAKQNHLASQYQLGQFSERGEGVERNSLEAIRWYQLSAQGGYLPAIVQLGKCYSKGYGVKKDLSKAMEWFHKAAVVGDAEAQYALGECYENGGNGVPRELEKALIWYRLAADQNHQEAMNRLQFYDATAATATVARRDSSSREGGGHARIVK